MLFKPGNLIYVIVLLTRSRNQRGDNCSHYTDHTGYSATITIATRLVSKNIVGGMYDITACAKEKPHWIRTWSSADVYMSLWLPRSCFQNIVARESIIILRLSRQGGYRSRNALATSPHKTWQVRYLQSTPVCCMSDRYVCQTLRVHYQCYNYCIESVVHSWGISPSHHVFRMLIGASPWRHREPYRNLFFL